MDPIACLIAAGDAILDGRIDEACDGLANYRAWRTQGGFEPTLQLPITPLPGQSRHAEKGDGYAKTLEWVLSRQPEYSS